jgi:hypothetical protein
MSSKRKRGDAATPSPSNEDLVVGYLGTKADPVSQQQLQDGTGLRPEALLQVLSGLLKEHRVKIYTSSAGTSWKLISEEQAAKLASLSVEERLVLGLIEKAGYVDAVPQPPLSPCVASFPVVGISGRKQYGYGISNCKPSCRLSCL